MFSPQELMVQAQQAVSKARLQLNTINILQHCLMEISY